jgi:hypothetical protein
MTEKQRILVVCPTDWERTAVRSPRLRERYEFLSCCEDLYDSVRLWKALRFDVQRYLRGVATAHRDRGIAGVLGTGDYPGCIFGAFVAEELGLPSPRAWDTVRLSHKYHSRELQRRVVPEATPHFEALDPRALREPQALSYPFFVKPVKGAMSIRAQLVRGPAELRQALSFSLRDRIRSWILLRPFSQLLSLYHEAPVPAWSFIAEEPLSGHQVTVDGFVQGGQVTVMGIVDSIMYPGTISFRRFEYPSTLPEGTQARMVEIASRLMQGVGFDHSCFNIEMFYDEKQDKISIIEINPRMTYQFSDLFERVDGMSSFAVQLGLATGQKIDWQHKGGPDRVAASFVMRRFSDAKVLAVPEREHLEEVERRLPGTHVKVLCDVGEKLSEHFQDVGSYRYCIVNMAAKSRDELHARYAEAEELLPFRFSNEDLRH